MHRHTLGSLMIAGCALSWGVIAVVVRELELPAMTIVFYRVLLSALAVASVVLLTGRRDLLATPSPAVLALGILLAAHWSLYFAAIKETSVASAVLITYTAPIFMALLAPVLIGERVPARSLAALAASLAGIALITLSGGSGSGAVRPAGVVLAALAAVTLALLIVLLKRYAADVDPVTVVLYEDGVAALVLWPAALFADYELAASDVGYLVLLGVALTGLGGVVYVSALRWVAATTSGILLYMEPVSAALLAAALLGEPLTAGVIVGGIAIVFAGAIVALRGPGAMAPSEEPVTTGR